MPDFLTVLRSHLPDVVRATKRGPVVEPSSTEDTALVLRVASEYGARLTPPGGDASADDERIPVDLRRMTRIVGYDEHSQVVHVQAGVSLHALAEDLRRRGRALAVTRELPSANVGTFLARGAPEARSKDEDPVDQLVAGLTVVLPDGHVVVTRPAPRRAIGPDLAAAMVGARGSLGIITAAHLVTRPRRPHRELHFLFSARVGAEAARAQLRSRGVRPDLAQVTDAAEGAALSLHLGGDGLLLDAFLAVARECASANRGVEVSARDVPALPPAVATPPSPIVAALAAAVDPEGVLSPRASGSRTTIV